LSVTRGRLREPAASDPRRRRVLAAVSLGTALWLVAELFVIVTTRSTTWPFSALTMFATPRSHAYVISLQGVARSGEQRSLAHEDFGLEVGNSLHVFITRRIVYIDGPHAIVRADGRHGARRLARLYNARHDDDPLTRLHVDVRITPVPFDPESPETTTRVMSVRP
jgi:hypothetical protein